MKSAPRNLAALLLIGGGVYLASRQSSGSTPTSGSGAVGSGGGGLDWSLPEWGSGWDWSFNGLDGSDGTADTPQNWYTEADMQKPRGIRNNNPGNVEYTGVQWQGLDNPPSDGRFMRFVSPEYGIRAIARVLDTYANTHGINTVAGIIQRWAPSHENPTNAYARYVAEALNVAPEQPLDIMANRPGLVAAIIEFENGQQPYSWATINKGVSMA